MSAGAVAALLVAVAMVGVGAATRARQRTRARRGLPSADAIVRTDGRPAPAWFSDRLTAAGVAQHARALWLAWLTAATVAPVLLLAAGGPGLAVLGGLVVAAAPPLAWRANRGRADSQLQAALPAALEAVARALRSGAGLRAAVAEAGRATPGPLGADLVHAARAADASGIVPALEAWGRARPVAGVRLAVAALCLGAETGGAQARAIDGVAVTLRQRLAVAAEARALASQARASAAVIAVAPVVFCGLTSLTDARVAAFLFRSGAGVAVLAAGLALDAVGAVWMARLTRVAL